MLGFAHGETRRPSASGSGELRVPPSAKRFSARALATRPGGRNLACRKMVASGAPKSTEPRTATALRDIDDVAVGSGDYVAVGSGDDVAVGSGDYLSSANT